MDGISIDLDWCEKPPFDSNHGERGLLWAVFTSGIESYCRGIETGAVYGPDFREAERWVFSQEPGLTAFSTLCDVFGMDARRLRLRLLDYREHPDRPPPGFHGTLHLSDRPAAR